MDRMEIAKTILMQMGGTGRLNTMVGANNYISHGDGVSFRFKGSKHSNYLKVTLNVLDTYDMEFGKVWGTKYTVKKEYDGVFFDQLKELFEKTTGLYLTF